jgi:hypothetical protein
MLRSAQALMSHSLQTLDGAIGSVREFYFDDCYWVARYLVVETGSWLTDRQVLISPYAVRSITETPKPEISVALTRAQISDSPPIATDKPVSLQSESDYHSYYGWPLYWSGPYTWGPSPFILRDLSKDRPLDGTDGKRHWDSHLRSTAAIKGYHVAATDGVLGHVNDFIIDDETWSIRYLVIHTGSWWTGNKVLIAPQWIERVSWPQSSVSVALSRETIRHSPSFTEVSAITREFEQLLQAYYAKQGCSALRDSVQSRVPVSGPEDAAVLPPQHQS